MQIYQNTTFYGTTKNAGMYNFHYIICRGIASLEPLGYLGYDGFLELVDLKNIDFVGIGNVRFSCVLYI